MMAAGKHWGVSRSTRSTVVGPARAATGYARYIGRVGALAVALGVGTAVATGQGLGVGVARADAEGSWAGAPLPSTEASSPGAATTGTTTTGTTTKDAWTADASATTTNDPASSATGSSNRNETRNWHGVGHDNFGVEARQRTGPRCSDQ